MIRHAKRAAALTALALLLLVCFCASAYAEDECDTAPSGQPCTASGSVWIERLGKSLKSADSDGSIRDNANTTADRVTSPSLNKTVEAAIVDGSIRDNANTTADRVTSPSLGKTLEAAILDGSIGASGSGGAFKLEDFSASPPIWQFLRYNARPLNASMCDGTWAGINKYDRVGQQPSLFRSCETPPHIRFQLGGTDTAADGAASHYWVTPIGFGGSTKNILSLTWYATGYGGECSPGVVCAAGVTFPESELIYIGWMDPINSAGIDAVTPRGPGYDSRPHFGVGWWDGTLRLLSSKQATPVKGWFNQPLSTVVKQLDGSIQGSVTRTVTLVLDTQARTVAVYWNDDRIATIGSADLPASLSPATGLLYPTVFISVANGTTDGFPSRGPVDGSTRVVDTAFGYEVR